MSEMRWLFPPIFLVLLLLLLEQSGVAATLRKGILQGTKEANLRAGPGVEHGIKGVVKENEQLTVQAQEGEWYLVETAAGQRGYIYKDFIKLAGEEPVGAFPGSETAKVAPAESKEIGKTAAADSLTTEQKPPAHIAPAEKIAQPALPSAPQRQPSAAAPKSDERRTSNNKAPSLIELLNGREGDMMIWAGIAIVFFLIGWVFGGHYYVRRDRTRRTRLRF
jgi:uncharacterized membrane protein